MIYRGFNITPGKALTTFFGEKREVELKSDFCRINKDFMKMRRSIKIDKGINGISFEIKNVKPVKSFLEKGDPKKDIKERPYRG